MRKELREYKGYDHQRAEEIIAGSDSTKEYNYFMEIRGTALTIQIGRVFCVTGSSSAYTTVIVCLKVMK